MAISLQEAFRVFTEGDSHSLLPGVALRVAGNILDGVHTMRLATDSSCEDQGEKTAKAGAGVFYAEGDEHLTVHHVFSRLAEKWLEKFSSTPVQFSSAPVEHQLNIKWTSIEDQVNVTWTPSD
ncbi:hypothetical protein BDN71DRAFT_1434564 [Pleurotus eryngii]|uniref:Uncharacterized protein n=1 Tax=Pleurotus eryngii TaxID=5323 RepID=A0A9P5ZMR4_PLEER|nr:hypothetical protein BDN71DRAFT_1434564 [Pleurotus eryngii]